MRKKNRQSRVGLGFLDPENMADKVVSSSFFIFSHKWMLVCCFSLLRLLLLLASITVES